MFKCGDGLGFLGRVGEAEEAHCCVDVLSCSTVAIVIVIVCSSPGLRRRRMIDVSADDESSR